ncbi:MAG: choice-of-anchor B family protein [Flavobacteriales bacterium]|nr:choice-of-anchor B family protein [Flavobacteriales bacterium]MCB9166373.1 choice-of-anchor B family protein [Flavobacteriales bacterium]
MRYPLSVPVLFFLSSPVVAQTLCESGLAGNYPCANIDLMARMDLTALGNGGGTGNDCWGWTDPVTGREYALMGLSNGTAFVDITDPVNPVLVGNLPRHAGTAVSIWRDIKTYADHAYIVSEASGSGIQVFDLTRLRSVTTPPETFTEDGHSNAVSNAHNIVIDTTAAMAYAVGSNQCSGGLYMFDLSTPTSPVLVGCYSQDGYIHDAQVVDYTGPDTDHQGQVIAFNCHLGNPDYLSIADVTDPTDPMQIATISWTNPRTGHQGWLSTDQRYFFLGDEGDELNAHNNTRTHIFDVQDLDQPVHVGYHDGPNASTDHNLYTLGGSIYEANYSSGLQVLDIVDAASADLENVAYFDTYPANNNRGYDGAWSTYPFYASGSVIISDQYLGLFIVRPRLSLRLHIVLDGAYDQGTGLMRDDLRANGLLPSTEPYTALGYVHVGDGGGELMDAGATAVTGPDAIVDWVVVELRDPVDPTIVLNSHAALLQRDGDVVGTDGVSAVQFSGPPGERYIAVRHRNHLGIMTGMPVEVSVAERDYDLSDGSVTLYGTGAAKDLSGTMVLWAGDCHADGVLKYTGANNDRDQVLTAIGGITPTATVNGYRVEDVTLDGITKYAGALNDRDPILVNVGGSVPTATRQEQLP